MSDTNENERDEQRAVVSDGQGGSLDLSRGSDRRMLGRALREGWGVTDEKLAVYAQALDHALTIATRNDNPRQINSVVQTMVRVVEQQRLLQQDKRDLVEEDGVSLKLEFGT